MIFSIEETRPDHIEEVFTNVREHDKPTFAALDDPAGALTNAVRRSSKSYVGRIDGEIVCLWGIEIRTILADSVFVWMMTTKTAEKHPLLFVRHARAMMKSLLRQYGRIEGTVVTTNTVAMRWVKWLGAELLPTPIEGVLEFRLHGN